MEDGDGKWHGIWKRNKLKTIENGWEINGAKRKANWKRITWTINGKAIEGDGKSIERGSKIWRKPKEIPRKTSTGQSKENLRKIDEKTIS